MRPDISARTRTVTRYYFIVVGCLAAITVGILWGIGGTITYNGVVERSSSPIGTSLHFNRTNVNLIVSDYYTDETNSVLIARIAPENEDALLKLPSSTKDYGIYAASKSFSGHETVPVLFGRFSTDGDMFLIIPRPTDEIYSFFIMNKNFFSVDLNVDEMNESEIVDLTNETASMSNALSQYRYLPASEKQGAVRVQSDEYDVVGFRMTLKPQFKNDAYKVKVLPGTLLSENGDFDFEAFFNSAFKNSASAMIEQRYAMYQTQMQAYENQKTEYESRLKRNPNDGSASTALSRTNEEIARLQEDIDELVDQMQAYSSLTYDDSLFNELVNEATVIEMS